MIASFSEGHRFGQEPSRAQIALRLTRARDVGHLAPFGFRPCARIARHRLSRPEWSTVREDTASPARPVAGPRDVVDCSRFMGCRTSSRR